ncbi:RagB/SusD family nutrient uptake outer membrane protein [Hymenobacter sp. ASUV-10]|uniref:RagB/SusD family nutrient uptake outer membrane protein n=1 Tax=Hymenobacter aranciens TaxID=3063996 RepID=A0ABT9BC94_9BACT|nr:RagB/SusD family nutrient uptake outer membrane protein [Hymenobacter sp. ASUV-10]MDO7875868.1 RagB/SusD family nutrient uptake outer membrane protein [Hymenobacter sp. ASUV-10]
MRTYLKLVPRAAALLVALSASSCKDFLEEDPKNFVAVTNFYKNGDDATAAVNAIYAYLNSTSTGSTAGVYHSSFWVAAGLASDELLNQQIFAPDLDQLSTFTHGPQNAALLEIWAMHYKAITIANIAIERIPGITMDQALKERLLGEARFLRGMLYFDMVRMFGSIPLLTKEVEPLTPTVATPDEIYAQIIADLKGAENLPVSYPSGAGRGRATQGAAKAMLAKVYLTRQDWTNAGLKSKEVIDSNNYALWADFADVFKLSSRNGKEAVFSVGFGDQGGAISFWEVGQFQVRLLPTELSAEGVENAQGWQVPTMSLYNSFDFNDRRREVTFLTQYTNRSGVVTPIRPYIQKYWDRAAEPTGNGSANDYPLMRYSEVLLNYAEANNELNQSALAHQYINMVRKRARFDGTTDRAAVPDYQNLTQEQMRAAILKERAMEFVGEGHRWFDLARTKTLETLVPLAKPGVVPSAKHYLFPIPQRERDLNPNLPQNGY